jgi:hypothetical protein
MRLVAGIAVVARGLARLRTGPPIESAIPELLAMAVGTLLLAGLWTPIVGSLLALLAIWNVISQAGDPWANILLGTIGVALALVGPGTWSADARLFGWKRIDLGDRKK